MTQCPAYSFDSNWRWQAHGLLFVFPDLDQHLSDVLSSGHEAEGFFGFVAAEDGCVQRLDDAVVNAFFEEPGDFEPVVAVTDGLIHNGVEKNSVEGGVLQHMSHSEGGVLGKIDFSDLEEATMLG